MTGVGNQIFRAALSFPDARTRFAGHFPAQVVIPGAALLDQAVAAIESATGQRVGGLKQVKFISGAAPADRLDLTATALGQQVRFEVLRDEELVCAGTALLEVSQ